MEQGQAAIQIAQPDSGGDQCAYSFCRRKAAGRADFDFSFLGLSDLSRQSPLCLDHIEILRRRVAKGQPRIPVRKKPQAHPEALTFVPTFLPNKPPAEELAEHPTREACRRLSFFRRKLLDSPARRDGDALQRALDEIMRALGPRARRGQIASAWVGLQLAIQESRARRWNARRTAEWVEVVAFYGGLCAYCEEKAWQHVDHVKPISKGGEDAISNAVPACQTCNLMKNNNNSLGWVPRRKHRLLSIQENQESREASVAS